METKAGGKSEGAERAESLDKQSKPAVMISLLNNDSDLLDLISVLSSFDQKINTLGSQEYNQTAIKILMSEIFMKRE